MISLLLILSSCSFNIKVFGNTYKYGEIPAQNLEDVETNLIKLEKFKSMPSLVPYDFEKENAKEEFELIKTNCIEAINNSYQKRVNDAYEVAYGLLGMGGSCFYIATLFCQRYWGKFLCMENVYQVYDPQPGDILYYFDGGLGVEHWGIYLDENCSLQGNYNGTTILINGYYLNNASYPIFLRFY